MEGISIIIPTLNEEDYIGNLLDCLANQTYKNFEVIVVDGNSDDGTIEVAQNYTEAYPLQIINSNMRDISHQLNLGADYAAYQRLLFLDADVTITNQFIERVSKKTKYTGIAGFKTLLSSGNVWEKSFFAAINIIFKLLSYFKPYSLGACIYSRREVHKKIKGFSGNFAEHFEYVQKASKIAPFKYFTSEYVYTSPRRFHSRGTKRTMMLWIRCFLQHLFTNKTPEVGYD